VQIYSNFSEFIHDVASVEKVADDRAHDDGLDLTAVAGISYDEITDAFGTGTGAVGPGAFGTGDDLLVKRTKIRQDVKAPQVTLQMFWDASKLLVVGLKKHGNRVELPSRMHMIRALQRLGQRVYQATDELQVRLRDVPVAYGNRNHHRLFLVVAPR
jgi:hypothetical protein